METWATNEAHQRPLLKSGSENTGSMDPVPAWKGIRRPGPYFDGPGPRTLLDLSLFCTPIYFRLAQQCAMRWSNNITRRVYSVRGPNSLWHIVELYCLVS